MVDSEIIRNAFRSHFGGEPQLYAAPGRVNLIGEHTDYNQGFVLPGAIDRAITVAIRPNGGKEHRVLSLDYNQQAYFIADGKKAAEHWTNYVIGVVMEFHSRCFAVPGFDAVFSGDIPLGGGLSSSAALESAFAFAINDLNGFGIGRRELAEIGQAAEHKYAGVRCGIMDQFASLHGRSGHLIKLDCRSLEYELLPFELPHHHVVLLDTQVKHSLASSEYNVRRAQCETGVATLRKQYPAVKSLRDVDLEMLAGARSQLDTSTYSRCQYVIEENLRLLQAEQCLRLGDLTGFGRLMYASHEGLSLKYNVSCPELDLLVSVAQETPGVLGARMMGGGFGGCTINLVETADYQDFVTSAAEKYSRHYGKPPLVYDVTIGDGASRLG